MRILVSCLLIMMVNVGFCQMTTLSIDPVIAQINEAIIVPVRVSGFENVGAFQFSINWDSQKLQFENVQNFGQINGFDNSDFGESNVSEGKLSIAWFDLNLNCESLEDGNILFELVFSPQDITMVGIPVEITDFPTEGLIVLCQANGSILEITPEYQNGTVTISEGITIVDAIVNNVSCYSFSDGGINIEVNGGTAPYSYNWEGAVNLPNENQLNNLATGNYQVTIIDANGLSTFQDYTITEPEAIEIIANIQQITCNEPASGAINLEISGGVGDYEISWNSGSNEPMINNLAEGVYIVTVTDENDCTTEATFTIELLSPLNLDLNSTNGCGENSGTAAVNPFGGTPPFEYLWSNQATTNNTSGLGDGIHFVTITDALDCEMIASVEIQNHPDIQIDVTQTDLECFNEPTGSVAIEVIQGTAPYSINWSNMAEEFILNNLEGGFYTYIIEDANGCTFNSLVNIQSPNEISVSLNFSTNQNMVTATAQTFGGTQPYQYLWSNGAVTNVANNLISNSAYSLTITDGNGCTLIEEFIAGQTTSQNFYSALNFKMYPNPTTDWLYLSFNKIQRGTKTTFSVFDVNGRIKWQKKINNDQTEFALDLRNYSTGMYILQLDLNNGQQLIKKFIKN